MSLRRQATWFWVSIAILCVVVVTMGVSTSTLISDHDEVDRELTQLKAWNELDVSAIELDSARRAHTLTGDPRARAEYDHARELVVQRTKRLGLSEDGTERMLLAQIQRYLAVADAQMQQPPGGQSKDADEQARTVLKTFRGLIDRVDDHEHFQQTERERSHRAVVTERVAQLLGLVLVCFAFVSLYRHMRERRQMQTRLERMNDELEQRVFERTSELRSANEHLSAEVAERERTLQSLRSTEEQLRQAQKLEAIGQLAGGIAHDFNNLLTVIITCGEVLADDDISSAERRELVGDVLDAGRRASELTRQLLAFSRRQVLAPEILDVNHSVERMTRMLHRLIGEHIDLRVVGHARASVEVDPGQLEQVLMNLAVNARDAMPSGGKLTIETRDVERESPAGAYVMIAVRDTGVGMDKDTQRRMFDPFFTTKPVGKGTGLGLATVLGIVQQSDGYVEVDSEPGVGTTFRIYFPVAKPKAEAAGTRGRNAGQGGDGETILVVEDDALVRKHVTAMLTRAGYRVLGASDGVDGIDVWRAHASEVDLVLTDVVMPRMGGRMFVETLERSGARSGVLYMTGYTDDETLLGGITANTVSFVQKPLERDALLRSVREALDARAAAN